MSPDFIMGTGFGILCSMSAAGVLGLFYRWVVLD